MKQIEVVAAVIIKNEKVFCAQRKDFGEVAKLWEFPGGKIKPNETHKEALIREFYEEFKTHIKVTDFLITVKHQYNTFFLTMHAYKCEIISGPLTLVEHIASEWVSKKDLDFIQWAPADIPIVKKLKELL